MVHDFVFPFISSLLEFLDSTCNYSCFMLVLFRILYEKNIFGEYKNDSLLVILLSSGEIYYVYRCISNL